MLAAGEVRPVETMAEEELTRPALKAASEVAGAAAVEEKRDAEFGILPF